MVVQDAKTECHCPTVGVAVGVEVDVGVTSVDVDLLLLAKPAANPAIVDKTTNNVSTPSAILFRDEVFLSDLALIYRFTYKSIYSEVVGRRTHSIFIQYTS